MHALWVQRTGVFYGVFLLVFYSADPSRLGNIVNRVTALLCVSAQQLWEGGMRQGFGGPRGNKVTQIQLLEYT